MSIQPVRPLPKDYRRVAALANRTRETLLSNKENNEDKRMLEHRASVLETELLRLNGAEPRTLADVYAEVEAIYAAAE